jgi:xanthine dehydrogenase YagS FAD-binding subunit
VTDLGYLRPTSAAEAVALTAADPTARFVAGGTELIPWMRQGLARPATLVDIARLPLQGVERRQDGLRIGALTRLVDVAANREVRRAAPGLARAIELAASPQLRHMATLGGNLLQETRCPVFRAGPGGPCNRRAPGSGCPVRTGDQRSAAILGATEACVATHPSDPAVALVALDARVTVLSPDGERETTVESLLARPPEEGVRLAPGELITAINLPLTEPGWSSDYVKVRDRSSFDFALVSAAASVRMAGGRITAVRLALGGVAPWPWRCRVAEGRLAESRLDQAALRAAFGAELAAAAPLPGNAFKVALAAEAGIRAVLSAAGGVG